MAWWSLVVEKAGRRESHCGFGYEALPGRYSGATEWAVLEGRLEMEDRSELDRMSSRKGAAKMLFKAMKDRCESLDESLFRSALA
jgi:hypothetical protein